MKKENFIIYGMVLVFAAYLLLLCALYVLNGQNKVSTDQAIRPSSLQEEILVRLESKGEVRVARNEGTLWINRKLSQCLITLGTTHGLEKGVLVDIYDGKKKVGKARVVQVFDVISYAELVGKTQGHFTKNYYSVSIP